MKDKYIKLVNPEIKYNLKDIDNILKSKNVTNSEWVTKLEEKIKKIHNVRYAVATNSGTMAFMLLYNSLPFKPKKIVMPAFTWGSIKEAVKWLDVKVEWVDIYYQNWAAWFGKRRSMFNKKTLFVPTHTFGNTTLYNNTKNFNFIYDAAHCVGNPAIQGQGLGSFFSFSPAKATTGIEGGMIITNNESIYKKALKKRVIMGRMSEINAYIAFQNLKTYKKRLKNKKKIYNLYKKELSKYGTFQKMCITNYNEIGFVFNDYVDKWYVEGLLYGKMDLRSRYDCPELPDSSYSADIRKHILMLPGNSLGEAKKVVRMFKAYLK